MARMQSTETIFAGITCMDVTNWLLSGSAFLLTTKHFYLGVSQREPKFKIALHFCLRSVTNRRLVSKAHASSVHAYSTWNLQKMSSWKVSTDSMISGAMKWYTNEHTVRGRPTLKDIKRFRNGSVCKPYERSIYERTFWVNLSRVMLYQRSHQPGLSTLQLDKKHLHKRHRMIVNQVAERLKNMFTNVFVRVHLSKTRRKTSFSIIKIKSRTKRYFLVIFL